MNNSLSAIIIRWIEGTNDWFSYSQLDREIRITHPKDKNIRRVVIHRLYKRGKLFKSHRGRFAIFKTIPKIKILHFKHPTTYENLRKDMK